MIEYNYEMEQADRKIEGLALLRLDLIKTIFETEGFDFGKSENNINYRNYMADETLMMEAGFGFGEGCGVIGGAGSYEEIAAQYGQNGHISKSAYETVKRIAALLAAGGLNGNAICGIIGNMNRESRFVANVVNSIGAVGLCQWLGSRAAALRSHCAAKGLDYLSIEGQVSYLLHELDTSLAKVKGIINNCTSPGDAAAWFSAMGEMGNYSSPEAAMNAWNTDEKIMKANGGPNAGYKAIGIAVMGANDAAMILRS